MGSTMRHRRLLALLAALAATPAAGAQTVASLEPDAWSVRPGATPTLRLVRAGSGDSAPGAFPDPRGLDWFFVRAAGHQDNLEHPARVGEGSQSRARVHLRHADTNLIGLDLTPASEEVDAASWARFLEERAGRPDLARAARAAVDPLAPETATVKLRRVECSKLLVRVEEPASAPVHSATAQSKSGQPVELRPLADPTATPPGSDLPLRVYVPGGSAEGLRVTARHPASGAVHHAATRAGGIAHFPVTAPGPWIVEVHQVVPLADDPRGAWEVRSATLAFVAPAAAPGDGGREKEDGR